MKLKRVIITLLFIMLLFSNCSFAADSELSINSEAAILMDSSTGKVIYEKNGYQKMYPASTTKILTAILTLENCNLTDTATVSYNAVMSVPSGYSNAALQIGEELTVEQLLQVLLVHSANDAANVLAYHISDSIDIFANLMNQKISELGLTNTHFTNPSGIHDKNHYTTAYDLSIIMKYCMKNSTFRNLSTLKYCKIPATNKYDERVYNTTNELLTQNNSSNYFYQYAIAGKTGYTNQAKNCLVSVSNKDNLELICVVLSAGLYPNNVSARFTDTKTLFNFGYDNYTIKKLREKDAIATQIEINNGTKETRNLELLISNDITALISQDDLETEFSPEIEINDNLSAPIVQGQVVGKIIYNIDEIKYSSDLVASHSVEKSRNIKPIIQIIMIVLILFFLYKLLFECYPRKKYYRKK